MNDFCIKQKQASTDIDIEYVLTNAANENLLFICRLFINPPLPSPLYSLLHARLLSSLAFRFFPPSTLLGKCSTFARQIRIHFHCLKYLRFVCVHFVRVLHTFFMHFFPREPSSRIAGIFLCKVCDPFRFFGFYNFGINGPTHGNKGKFVMKTMHKKSFAFATTIATI